MSAPEHRVVGEVLAEEMIRELSHSPDLNVISRLSTTAFRGRQVTLAEINAHLNADYVLSGVYRVDGSAIRLDAELAEAESAHIVWSRRYTDQIAGILGGERELIGHVVVGCVQRDDLARAAAGAVASPADAQELHAADGRDHLDAPACRARISSRRATSCRP